MQTELAAFIRDTPHGREAEAILRACVHCGFCTATCPTYQLLGDELDGPRGRIYQIKQVLEGQPATENVRGHLDRCLTCRACETTCPSGVDYHRLLDIGRETVDTQLPRPLRERILRKSMIMLMAYRKRFTPVLRMGQSLRPLLPRRLRRQIPPPARQLPPPPATDGTRRIVVLDGCVQPALAPDINQALALLLARMGIRVATAAQSGCCGALPHHLSDSERAQAMARRNIDAWMPAIDAGAEAVVVTASGCGAHVRDYPQLLAADPVYSAKARQIVDRLRDPVQLFADVTAESLNLSPKSHRVAVHTPCTLQHALHLNGQVEALLQKLGYELCLVQEGHLCCGSAGTYSILQADLSQQLRQRKLNALQVDHPDVIVTANIGCLTHLDDEDGTPVRHWLNLLADDLV
jgi:glycolate oxidase iron-sulfur subunit